MYIKEHGSEFWLQNKYNKSLEVFLLLQHTQLTKRWESRQRRCCLT